MRTFTWEQDPLWPWSSPAFGLPALAVVGLLLVALTIWTYLGVRQASARRIGIFVALRLLALLLAVLMLLRPALALHGDAKTASTLLIGVDFSESMSNRDEFNSQSRWDRLCNLLRDSQPLLDELQEKHNIQIVYYSFAGDVVDFDAAAKAEGKRTDFGNMLRFLFDRHSRERNLRGLLVLSDGADNGTRLPPLPEAAKWRGVPCPVHTFAFGQPTAADRQPDIALTAINVEPSPVPIKAKMTVKGLIDAAGFLDAPVLVHLLIDDKEVLSQQEKLAKFKDNEVRMVVDAPATPGEIKVTLKVDPLPGEMSALNNEISTYATISKEGISVLLVDRLRAGEPQRICDALSADPRIRLYLAWRQTDRPDPKQTDLFEFAKQHYDVIIVGDVSANRMAPSNPKVLAQIHELVANGAGFLMMGGSETFANSDWQGTDIAKLLPVELDVRGQSDDLVKMVPTTQGLAHFVLRLDNNEARNKALWDQLPELQGYTRLGKPKEPLAIVLARTPTGIPLLVAQSYGKGRTVAFAADTTHHWERLGQPKDFRGVEAHHRFWRQMVYWLARQDEAEGTVWVKPNARRLRAGEALGFSVGIRGKGGVDLKGGKFEVTVATPDKTEPAVQTAQDKGEERGTFARTDAAGEYKLTVRGQAKDADGQEARGAASVRFLVYEDDAERLRPEADHDFLKKLANAGGGKFHRAEDLPRFLQEMAQTPPPQGRPKPVRWPDWTNKEHSGFSWTYFLAFVGVLGVEWFLRRTWGLV